jgi:branched-chain amino acid transport system substrate-binding protein
MDKRGCTGVVVAVLFLGFALLLSGAPWQTAHAAPAAPATIKVGVVLPLTGNMAAGGKWVKQGYEVAVKHINSAGGVNVKEFGKKIPLELLFLDDESNPGKIAGRMEKLYSIDKIDFFLGGFAAHLLIPQQLSQRNTRSRLSSPRSAQQPNSRRDTSTPSRPSWLSRIR